MGFAEYKLRFEGAFMLDPLALTLSDRLCVNRHAAAAADLAAACEAAGRAPFVLRRSDQPAAGPLASDAQVAQADLLAVARMVNWADAIWHLGPNVGDVQDVGSHQLAPPGGKGQGAARNDAESDTDSVSACAQADGSPQSRANLDLGRIACALGALPQRIEACVDIVAAWLGADGPGGTLEAFGRTACCIGTSTNKRLNAKRRAAAHNTLAWAPVIRAARKDMVDMAINLADGLYLDNSHALARLVCAAPNVADRALPRADHRAHVNHLRYIVAMQTATVNVTAFRAATERAVAMLFDVLSADGLWTGPDRCLPCPEGAVTLVNAYASVSLHATRLRGTARVLNSAHQELQRLKTGVEPPETAFGGAGASLGQAAPDFSVALWATATRHIINQHVRHNRQARAASTRATQLDVEARSAALCLLWASRAGALRLVRGAIPGALVKKRKMSRDLAPTLNDYVNLRIDIDQLVERIS
jgi:hypothetical protein